MFVLITLLCYVRIFFYGFKLLIGSELLHMVFSDTSVSTLERMKKKRTPSVIVIGAGMAGIAAARTLQDASFQVCNTMQSFKAYNVVTRKEYSYVVIPKSESYYSCLLLSFSGCVIGVS